MLHQRAKDLIQQHCYENIVSFTAVGIFLLKFKLVWNTPISANVSIYYSEDLWPWEEDGP